MLIFQVFTVTSTINNKVARQTENVVKKFNMASPKQPTYVIGPNQTSCIKPDLSLLRLVEHHGFKPVSNGSVHL